MIFGNFVFLFFSSPFICHSLALTNPVISLCLLFCMPLKFVHSANSSASFANIFHAPHSLINWKYWKTKSMRHNEEFPFLKYSRQSGGGQLALELLEYYYGLAETV